MEGQVAVFDASNGPCYRCIFPEPPDGSIPLDCTTIGVLGSITGVLGSLQATETIKLIVSAIHSPCRSFSPTSATLEAPDN